ncbi:hypothetical protein G6F35_015749 [Rhizopus arrhizus]|nr:hypothetical protein G6F35_015749 [Rhizopus arrhizus]
MRLEVAQRIERPGAARRGLDAAASQPQSDNAQGQIDQEDAAPSELVDPHAAQQWAGGARYRHDGRPGGQHPVAYVFVFIRMGQQAQGAGHEQRGAHALQHASRNQRIRVDGLGAVAVRQRSGHQQQGGEGERVAVHDPDQVGQRDGELQRNAGQRHVDHGDVQHGHHKADGQRDER